MLVVCYVYTHFSYQVSDGDDSTTITTTENLKPYSTTALTDVLLGRSTDVRLQRMRLVLDCIMCL